MASPRTFLASSNRATWRRRAPSRFRTLASQHEVARCVRQAERLIERCSSFLWTGEHHQPILSAEQYPDPLLTAQEIIDRERLVRERQRGSVLIVAFEVIERAVQVAKRPLTMSAPQELLTEVHAHRAMELLRVLLAAASRGPRGPSPVPRGTRCRSGSESPAYSASCTW